MAGPHLLIRSARRLSRLIGRRRWGGRGGPAAPFIGRNLLHSYNFPERTIGKFSDITIFICGEMLQPPYISIPPTLLHVCMYEENIVLAITSSPGMVVSSLCYLKEDEYSQKGITLTQQYTAAFK